MYIDIFWEGLIFVIPSAVLQHVENNKIKYDPVKCHKKKQNYKSSNFD